MRKHLPVIVFTMISFSALTHSSLALVVGHLAAALPTGPQTHTAGKMITPDALEWKPRWPGLEMAVLSGDPTKEGVPFVLRLKLSDGTKVPPHWHPIDEHVTVMAGVFHLGMGEKFDRAAAPAMTAGSYSMMPKEMRHFAWAEGETIIQLHGIGPFKTVWVNPADDPSKKAGND